MASVTLWFRPVKRANSETKLFLDIFLPLGNTCTEPQILSTYAIGPDSDFPAYFLMLS